MEKLAKVVKPATSWNVPVTGPVTIGGATMTDNERQEVQRILEGHEHTVAVCRACAETTRDLAWEVRRGARPSSEALAQTIGAAEQVLADLGQVEVAIAKMKASLW